MRSYGQFCPVAKAAELKRGVPLMSPTLLDLSLRHAVDSGRLEVIGAAKARPALRAWLNLSPLAAIRSQRPDTEAA